MDMASNARIIRQDLEGRGRSLIKILPHYLPRGSGENREKYQVTIQGVQADIQTKYLPMVCNVLWRIDPLLSGDSVNSGRC
jgi:hypothetical protein